MVFICMAVVVLVINLPIAILARVFDDQKLNWSALVELIKLIIVPF